MDIGLPSPESSSQKRPAGRLCAKTDVNFSDPGTLLSHLSHVTWMQHQSYRLWLLWTNGHNVICIFNYLFNNIIVCTFFPSSDTVKTTKKKTMSLKIHICQSFFEVSESSVHAPLEPCRLLFICHMLFLCSHIGSFLCRHVIEVDVLLSDSKTEPKTRAEFLKYSCQVTLERTNDKSLYCNINSYNFSIRFHKVSSFKLY